MQKFVDSQYVDADRTFSDDVAGAAGVCFIWTAGV